MNNRALYQPEPEIDFIPLLLLFILPLWICAVIEICLVVFYIVGWAIGAVPYCIRFLTGGWSEVLRPEVPRKRMRATDEVMVRGWTMEGR
ncbi:uncharacterized protein C8A04DRAFT_32481 [Dichotomopilus funicola]|uniref:Uncharacterized protein n=1 Tax=Dichotomopilus funicola TaxID=1934379 RepID=A0AAN6UW19_9PEZI|nr:hypothetical protein C8A04DRAFT_32481 [Dichotomopilus funicola]